MTMTVDESAEVKQTVGKNPLENRRKEKGQLLQNIKGGSYIMKSLLVVFRGVRECLQLGGSGEEESGHKGRMVFHKLS